MYRTSFVGDKRGRRDWEKDGLVLSRKVLDDPFSRGDHHHLVAGTDADPCRAAESGVWGAEIGKRNRQRRKEDLNLRKKVHT